MKKLILLAFAAVIMVGCKKDRPRQEDIQPEVEEIVVYQYRTMTIDSCEYLGIGAHGFSHKGNCRFCEERRQKEMKKLIESLREN